jgi:hypothetical protein
VSHADGTNPESDRLNLPEEGLLEGLPLGDRPPGESPPLESPLAAAAAAEAEAGAAQPEEAAADRKKKKREKRKKKDRKEREPTWVAAEAPGPSLLERLCQSSPYTVMLAVALAGLLIGCLFLVLELGSYGFQFSPRK